MAAIPAAAGSTKEAVPPRGNKAVAVMEGFPAGSEWAGEGGAHRFRDRTESNELFFSLGRYLLFFFNYYSPCI